MPGDETIGDGGADEPWSVRETVTEFECPWFEVGSDLVERPDGETARYYWMRPSPAVSVAAVTDDGELVVVEQYRPRQRQRVVSCPGGIVEDGESMTEAARRELREETGFDAGTVRHLETYAPSGWLRQEFGAVYATDLDPGAPDPDDGEFVRHRTMPVEDALAAIRAVPASMATGMLPVLLARDEGLL